MSATYKEGSQKTNDDSWGKAGDIFTILEDTLAIEVVSLREKELILGDT